MDEKEKMLNGYLYDATIKELEQERFKAKNLCHKLNLVAPSDIQERDKIIRELFGKCGKNACVLSPFYCDYGYNIEAGDNFFTNHNCVILDCAKVEFGDNVFVAPNCGFYTAGHPIDAETRNKWVEFAHPIKVGNNVWFGGNVCVLPGVTIGDNVVIGAGSVVNKDIPANVIAAGNPCRVIREITSKDKDKYRRYIG